MSVPLARSKVTPLLIELIAYLKYSSTPPPPRCPPAPSWAFTHLEEPHEVLMPRARCDR